MQLALVQPPPMLSTPHRDLSPNFHRVTPLTVSNTVFQLEPQAARTSFTSLGTGVPGIQTTGLPPPIRPEGLPVVAGTMVMTGAGVGEVMMGLLAAAAIRRSRAAVRRWLRDCFGVDEPVDVVVVEADEPVA